MAGVAFAEPRSSFSHRALVARDVRPVLRLLAPALLLGVLRVWASTAAPRLGVYFTAEALLIAYAYYAVVRCTYLDAHGRDRMGGYRHDLALAAASDFNRGLRRYWAKIAIATLSLLVAALALDLLSARTGMQHRANVHLTILIVEVMVWARYGGAILIAAARWKPPRPAAFAAARTVAESSAVAKSFALANLGFGVVALMAVAAYKWSGVLLPNARAELYYAAVLFTGIALLALWTQCRWVRTVHGRIEMRSRFDAAMPEVSQAA